MATAPKRTAPALFVEADAMAMKALQAGNANEGQQQRALDWILRQACALPAWAYRETERETCVALGRQFVGQQIVTLIQHVPTRRPKDAS